MATCRHFGSCGGCATQDVPYAEEIRRKEAALRELFGRAVPVGPSPREFHYRTRMDYVYAWGKLGLRKRGDPRGVLDLDECLLVSARAFETVLKVKEAIHRHDLRSYSYVAKKGYLRYVTVREAPVAGQLMLIFLTNGPDPAVRVLLEEAEAWAEAVVWSVTERRADLSSGEVKEHRGRDWIEERIGDVRYRFGANSFFQANPWQTEALYRHVSARVQGRTTDLFCGVGGFALFVAPHAADVNGVDHSEEAIAFARQNAELNGRAVRFEAQDARAFLREHRCDTLILDPPRAGLGLKCLRQVLRAAPARILYVSCNPKLLAAELPQFEGYVVQELQGFDLFPKTPHVEVVATLVRNPARRP
ncbi:MAG: 23S rRNA (uracil(1939)-C(5))-methyltransferase RlmD [Planctomycetota bacterium]